MPRKPTVLIDVTHHDVSKGHIKGIGFTADYGEGQTAWVSMLEFPPLSEPELESVFRQRLLDLGRALQEVGQSSSSIFWHHR
jgi:hypothetical protein